MGLSVRFCQLISLLVGPVLIAALQRAGHHSILLLFASPAGGAGGSNRPGHPTSSKGKAPPGQRFNSRAL